MPASARGARLGDAHPLHRAGVLRDLGHPRDLIGHLGPNWFTTIMGTGIVAVAAVSLPVGMPGLRGAAVLVWALSAVAFLALGTAWTAHWVRHRETARSHASDPFMAPFHGAPPMALITVGTGTLLVGRDVLGEAAAVRIDMVLWAAGTGAGLVVAVVIPFLMITRHDLGPVSVSASWLMPVVPPMVSAAGGALLVPYVPAGELRLALVVGCYAMVGLSLFASVIITTLVWYRLMLRGPGPAFTVPTLWIVLGPLGQSITAVHLLGDVAHLALPVRYAALFAALGPVFGLPVLGFALFWIVLAGAITVRTARRGMPFALTWWSFTFPLGTVVTGASVLAVHTGSAALTVLAVALFAGLLIAWAVVATRTVLGSVSGRLFRPLVLPDPL